MKSFFKKAIATIFTLLTCALCIFVFSSYPTSEPRVKQVNYLNLDGYELVFYDEFDGDELDQSKWGYRATGVRRGGYFHPDQVSVEGGNLVITGEYTTSDLGEGWHAGSVSLKEWYTYGYFEIRCIPNSSADFWSAFWLQSLQSYDHDLSKGGVGGAEIDIFETFKGDGFGVRSSIFSTIHCNGHDDDAENLDSLRVATVFVPKLLTTYHTFGLMWTENEYIFFVDGKETARSSFGSGVSQAPEEVIVSLCLPDEFTIDKSTKTRFLTDYVKIYQLEKR